MPISENLAYQLYVIIFANLVSTLVLLAFSYYVYLRGQKNALLKSYLVIVWMISIWMIAKVFKSVAPTIELRWFFIVIQYFGVAYLSYALLNFALIYHFHKPVHPKLKAFMLIPPTVFFLLVMTNPLHMKYYSHFNFYQDSFGDFFYPLQIMNYLYMLIAVIILIKSKAEENKVHKKNFWGHLMAAIATLSLSLNFYYILFKAEVLEWYFSFPIFDITPIAVALSLIFFMIPVIKFRFFDIMPVSFWKNFQKSHQGIAFFDQNFIMFNANPTYKQFFGETTPQPLLEMGKGTDDFHFKYNNKCFKVIKESLHQNSMVLYIEDQSSWYQSHEAIKKQHEVLKAFPETLKKLEAKKNNLAITQVKNSMAQNMHDILGHSLTVVIGYCEWIQKQNQMEVIASHWGYIKELLMSSLNDLKNSFAHPKEQWSSNSLIKAIEALKDVPIALDFNVQGDIHPLSTKQSQCIYRLSQEAITNAIKHGKATKINIILRYQKNTLTFYILDNGKGCQHIKPSYGLKGIQNRVSELGGLVSFTSDGESGFVIKGHIDYLK